MRVSWLRVFIIIQRWQSAAHGTAYAFIPRTRTGAARLIKAYAIVPLNRSGSRDMILPKGELQNRRFRQVRAELNGSTRSADHRGGGICDECQVRSCQGNPQGRTE